MAYPSTDESSEEAEAEEVPVAVADAEEAPDSDTHSAADAIADIASSAVAASVRLKEM